MNIPLVTRVRFANNEKSLLAIASADGVISVCHVECASIVPVCESPTGTEPFPAGAAADLGPLREVRSASPTTHQQLSPIRDLDADAGALPPAALVGLGARDHSAPPSCPLPTAATATPAAATHSEAEAEAGAGAGAREAVVKLEMSAQSLSDDSLELEAVSPRSDSDSISPALSPTGATATAGGTAGGHELDTRQQALAAQPPPLPQFDSISQMSFLSPSSEPALSGSSRLQSNSYVLHTLRGHTGPINGILYYTSHAVSFITHTRKYLTSFRFTLSFVYTVT